MCYILIGNKMDVKTRDIVIADDAKEFANEKNLNYYEVSAKTGSGIVNIFEKITKKIINNIKNSIETLIELKACEKYEEKLLNDESKKNYHNNEDKNDENGLLLYEGMLRKAEKDIRKHIRVNIYYFNIYNFS